MEHPYPPSDPEVLLNLKTLEHLLHLSPTPLCIINKTTFEAVNTSFQALSGLSDTLVGKPTSSAIDFPALDGDTQASIEHARILKAGQWMELPVSLSPVTPGSSWLVEVRGHEKTQNTPPNSSSHATRLRNIGELAAGVAHDANNALTTVIGRLLRIKARGHIPSALRADLDIIEAASRHTAVTLKRIQTMSHPELESHLELVPLPELIEEVAQFVDSQLPCGVILDLDIAHTPDTLANRHELLEVVLNLTRNAIDAVSSKGGLVTLRVSRESDCPMLEVTDTGPGIPQAIQEKIFTPFFSTKGTAGTGLGLSVSRDLLGQIGASIELQSTPNEGSTFKVLFKPNTTQRAPTSRTTSRKDLRVLVVDDDAHVGELLEELLEMEGHHVTRASSGAEAIDSLRGKALDLVLTDLDLPETHGLELAQELRAIHPDIIIGLVTGWPLSLEERSRATEIVDFVLGKPFTRAELKLSLGRVQSSPLTDS